MAQILKPIELGTLTIIILIGVIALSAELTQNEEVAKIIVIPSLTLLIIVSIYSMFKTAYLKQ
jgi:hypothetical protein